MRRLFPMLSQLFTWFAVATLLAQILLLGFAVRSWDLNRDRLIQILALAQGVDLFTMRESALVKAEDVAVEQVSFDEIRATRALEYRNLERREQALASGLAQLRTEQQNLAEERGRFKAARDAFETQLYKMREGALAEGVEEVRRILETVRPDQAKIQLMEMLNNDEIDTVVVLLAGMPDSKRSKIIGEFETPPEQTLIAEVLARILEGVPDAELAAETQEGL